MLDPYHVLGVDRDASPDEIKRAFRRRAAECHPDRNPGDESAQTRFKEVNAAYQILCDPKKRAAYDRFGPAALNGLGGAGDFVDIGAIGLDGIFGDILGAFGIRTGDRGDFRLRLRVSFEEAILGCDKEVTYERQDLCESCQGSCAEPGTSLGVCRACNGRGRVRMRQGVLPIAVESACASCRGTGNVARTPCKTCSGTGLTRGKRSLEVSLPPGIEHHATRTIEAAGNRVRLDRPPGDLEIVVEVAAHPLFRRTGDDIACRVPISFAQAALGGEVEVPSLQGRVKVRVPPSTQPGTVLRLRGKGAPHRYRAGRGDQLIEVAVEVPTELSLRAQELIAELGKELGEDVQPQQRTFVEKLKGLFE